jgi:hypothetical protein
MGVENDDADNDGDGNASEDDFERDDVYSK